MQDLSLWLGILLASACASCTEDVQFKVKASPELQPRATVSMLGVFRDGRMSPESWSEVGPPLSTPLGQPLCPAAYGDDLLRADPELFASFDERTRADGITDELLEQLAPSAEGELILTLSISGRAELPRGTPPARSMRAPPPAMRGGGRSMGVPGPQGRMPQPLMARNELEVSASFYSVKLHRSVGRLTMAYAGPSLDDALAQFATKLGTVVPGAICHGWHFPPARSPAPAPR